MSARLPLTAADVATACGGSLATGDPARPLASFSTDTRTLQRGDAFIALRGPNFDGHAFVDDALSAGAGGLILAQGTVVALRQRPANLDVPVIVVDDTLLALQSLARHVRRVSGARVVAITGSAGKTSTKEATGALLSARFRTMRNKGNLNNHIGLPLSLLDLQQGFEVAVVELGMNHAGEISRLIDIAEPDVRVWTNVGTAHLEFFGTQDAIAEAKAEVLERATADTIFVANADDPRVVARARGFPGRVITFGVSSAADVHASDIDDRGADGQHAKVDTPVGRLDLDLPLPGRGQLLNVLAAIAVATEFGIATDDMAARLSTLRPAAHRGEVARLARGARVFDDCYNSSPSALQRALEIVASTRVEGRRIGVLGEMLELGTRSEALHRECGQAAVRAGISRLMTVGGAPARALGEAARAAGLFADALLHVGTSAEAADRIPGWIGEGDFVLVKGSRGIHLEVVVDRLKEELA